MRISCAFQTNLTYFLDLLDITHGYTDACLYEREKKKKTFERIWYIVDRNVAEPKRGYFLGLHQ